MDMMLTLYEIMWIHITVTRYDNKNNNTTIKFEVNLSHTFKIKAILHLHVYIYICIYVYSSAEIFETHMCSPSAFFPRPWLSSASGASAKALLRVGLGLDDTSVH